MLTSLEEALKYVLCRHLEGDDKRTMEISIKQFIIEDAGEMTAEELLTEFNTPKQSVDRFIAYLEKNGAYIGAGTTIH